jgi:hypothetical protein
MFNHASAAVDTGNWLLSKLQVSHWMISPRLDTEQRRALELLASSRFGISEDEHEHAIGWASGHALGLSPGMGPPAPLPSNCRSTPKGK